MAKKSKVKLDDNKLRYDLLPFDAIDEVIKVLTYGAKKYNKSQNNWRINSNKQDIKRYEAALLRHYSEYSQGNKIDSESKLHHFSHIATNALFIIALLKKFKEY